MLLPAIFCTIATSIAACMVALYAGLAALQQHGWLPQPALLAAAPLEDEEGSELVGGCVCEGKARGVCACKRRCHPDAVPVMLHSPLLAMAFPHQPPPGWPLLATQPLHSRAHPSSHHHKPLRTCDSANHSDDNDGTFGETVACGALHSVAVCVWRRVSE